jgi:hypothetical protein
MVCSLKNKKTVNKGGNMKIVLDVLRIGIVAAMMFGFVGCDNTEETTKEERGEVIEEPTKTTGEAVDETTQKTGDAMEKTGDAPADSGKTTD